MGDAIPMKTILGLDATGSMGNVIEPIKKSIAITYKRIF